LTQGDGAIVVEFTFVGFEEGDEICGRGRATIADDGLMRGTLFYFQGDAFSFEARR
jgi:hypothetical protein